MNEAWRKLLGVKKNYLINNFSPRLTAVSLHLLIYWHLLDSSLRHADLVNVKCANAMKFIGHQKLCLWI